MICNLTDTAQIFGVSSNTMRVWLRKGCPFVEKGGQGSEWKLETADVARWREEQAAAAVTGYIESMDFEEARRQKMAAEAKLAQLDLAERCRQVVLIEDVEKVIRDEYANARARLLGLPAKLAGLLDGMSADERRACIEEGIKDALAELSADGDFAADGDEGQLDAAADADGQ